MFGLMQQQFLQISSLIDFAARHHGDGEVVSRRVEGDIHRYTWADVALRSHRVANALDGGAIFTLVIPPADLALTGDSSAT